MFARFMHLVLSTLCWLSPRCANLQQKKQKKKKEKKKHTQNEKQLQRMRKYNTYLSLHCAPFISIAWRAINKRLLCESSLQDS